MKNQSGESGGNVLGRPTQGQGYSQKGYNPAPDERTFNGYVNDNIPSSAELNLYTPSAGFNNNQGGVGGIFKRFGVNSHGGVSPHVHQPIRNVTPNGDIFGALGRKTFDGGVTYPREQDIKQLYQHINNGKYS